MDARTLSGIFAVGFVVGFVVAQSWSDAKIEKCHGVAEQSAGEVLSRAMAFAQCMSPRHYDPLYDYKRLQGK